MNDGNTTLHFEIMQDDTEAIRNVFSPDKETLEETKRIQEIVFSHAKSELKHLCPNATNGEMKILEKFAFLFACIGWNLKVEYDKGVL